MENLSFIYNRKSIRKFKNIEVKEEDIIKNVRCSYTCPITKKSTNLAF